MTFHGINHLINTTTRKRTTSYNNNNNNNIINTTPINIMTSTSHGGGTYRGSTSSIIIDGICSSHTPFSTLNKDDHEILELNYGTSSTTKLNFKPVNITFNDNNNTNNIIDVSDLSNINDKDGATIEITKDIDIDTPKPPQIVTSNDVISIPQKKNKRKSIINTQTNTQSIKRKKNYKPKNKSNIISSSSSTSRCSHRNINELYKNHHYNNNIDTKTELWELCKWCLFCLAALGSCIVFISYLLQITGARESNASHPSNINFIYNNNNNHNNMNKGYGTHHINIENKQRGSSYMMRANNIHGFSGSFNNYPIHSNTNNINHHSIDRININEKEMEFSKIGQSIHSSQSIKSPQSSQTQKTYHLVRNDKYSILNDILFIVFKSETNADNNDEDGRDSILKSWGKKYKDYNINIKFVNTVKNRFKANDDGQLYPNVIEAPFSGQSAMCLFWAIDEFSDGFKWIFKMDDTTFVMIENLVDYLNQIEQESSLIAHSHSIKNNNNNNNNNMDIEHHYYWWLGSSLASDGSGYLLNRAILDLIVDDIRNYDEINGISINDNENRKYSKYMMCNANINEDICIEQLLNNKYNIQSISTLDADNNEKFNNYDPITLFGFGELYQLPINHNIDISKTPISFHNVSPKWMIAYYELLYLHINSRKIDTIKQLIGNNESKYKQLNNYAKNVMQYSLTNHIKNIKNEMKHIIVDINFNLVK